MPNVPKPGDLVLIKTTEEPVIVLAVRTFTEEEAAKLAAYDTGNMPSRTMLTVRRPVAGQDGISHQIDTFYLEEVEFPTDRSKRLREEYSQMVAEKAASEPSPVDSKSSIN